MCDGTEKRILGNPRDDLWREKQKWKQWKNQKINNKENKNKKYKNDKK